MTGTGDHGPEMPAAPLLDEVTIDAILHGDDAPHGVRNLAAFAAGVMAVGEEPPPQPSPQLAAFLAHGGPTLAVERATVVVPAVTRRRSALARVAGVSLVAKISVATTAAAAVVVGAGATGMLPGPASGVVRDAIEVVTPVEFTDDDPGGEPDRGDARPERRARYGSKRPRRRAGPQPARGARRPGVVRRHRRVGRRSRGRRAHGRRAGARGGAPTGRSTRANRG